MDFILSFGPETLIYCKFRDSFLKKDNQLSEIWSELIGGVEYPKILHYFVGSIKQLQ